MDIIELITPVIGFLTAMELILVLVWAFLYATTPYAEGLAVAHRYKCRKAACVYAMLIYGVALAMLLTLNQYLLNNGAV